MAGIDYDRSAGDYRQARTLPAEILARWRMALTPFVTPGSSLVDVGAGTGQFLDPLVQWFGAQVIALEPSAGMRAAAGPSMSADGSPYVAGVAERLPFADQAFDGAWLSTVVHQFADRSAAAGELRRIVRPGGRVLVRGFFADLEVTSLLARFPGVDRAAASFPSSDEVVDLFAAARFRSLASVDVVESWTFDLDDWTARVRRMRNIDSALRPFTDDEIREGLARVATQHVGHDGPIVSDTTLRLLVFGD